MDGTIPAATQHMKQMNKTYDPHVFDGAGHGFFRQQNNDANKKAAEQGWAEAITFLKKNLG